MINSLPDTCSENLLTTGDGTHRTRARSSWLEIGLAAMEINAACLDTDAGTAGAVTFTGAGDRIKITLRGTTKKGVASTMEGNDSRVEVGSE